MKRLLPIAAALVLVSALVLLLRPPPGDPGSVAIPAVEDAPVSSPQPVVRGGSITVLPVAAQAASLNSPELTAEDDLATIEMLLAEYRKHHGGNPVGDNVDITAALRGRNSNSLGYLPPGGSFIDRDGRLIDRWGSPYFFHALSGQHIETRSAGPDREMWTADDLVR